MRDRDKWPDVGRGVDNRQVNHVADMLARYRARGDAKAVRQGEAVLRAALKAVGKTKPPKHDGQVCGIDFADSCLECRRGWLSEG